MVPGLPVYHAPGHAEFTRYVFLAQLKKLKGSDASWEHNNEPPPNVSDSAKFAKCISTIVLVDRWLPCNCITIYYYNNSLPCNCITIYSYNNCYLFVC